MVPVSITLSDPGLGFQGRSIYEIKHVKTVLDRVTVTVGMRLLSLLFSLENVTTAVSSV